MKVATAADGLHREARRAEWCRPSAARVCVVRGGRVGPVQVAAVAQSAANAAGDR